MELDFLQITKALFMESVSQRFNRDREKLLREFGFNMGIGYTDLESLRQTLGVGIKNGQVKFQAGDGTEGNFGTLYYVIEVKGKKVARIKTITNPNEAAFIVGLQQEIASKLV